MPWVKLVLVLAKMAFFPSLNLAVSGESITKDVSVDSYINNVSIATGCGTGVSMSFYWWCCWKFVSI